MIHSLRETELTDLFTKENRSQQVSIENENPNTIKFKENEYCKSDWILNRTKNILNRYSISEKYSFKNFDVKSVIQERIKTKLFQWDFISPEVCSLLSNQTGIGKTHLAVSILKHFVFNRIEMNFADEKNYVEKKALSIYDPGAYFYYFPKVQFVKFLKLADEVQSSYSQSSNYSEYDIIEKYSKFDFLIIDDLFSLKKTEFAERIIFAILDNRIEDSKPTVITSNVLSNEMDFRLFSRINNSMLIEIKSELQDYRQLK